MKVALLSTLLLPSATFAIGPIAPTENDAVTTRTYTDAGCVTIASAMTAKANVCAPISTTATARVTTTYPSGSSAETRLFTTTVYTDLGCGTAGGAALPIGAGSSTIQEGVCQQKAGSTTLWEQAIRFSETKNTVLAGVYTEKTCTTPGVNPLYLHTEVRLSIHCSERFAARERGGERGRGEGSAREVGGEARASEAWRRAAASVLLESGGA